MRGEIRTIRRKTLVPWAPAAQQTAPSPKVAWRDPLRETTAAFEKLQVQAAAERPVSKSTASYWDWLPPEVQELIFAFRRRAMIKSCLYRLLAVYRLIKYSCQSHAFYQAIQETVFRYDAPPDERCHCPPRYKPNQPSSLVVWRNECASCWRDDEWRWNKGKGRLWRGQGSDLLLRFIDDWCDHPFHFYRIGWPHIMECVAYGRPRRFWEKGEDEDGSYRTWFEYAHLDKTLVRHRYGHHYILCGEGASESDTYSTYNTDDD